MQYPPHTGVENRRIPRISITRTVALPIPYPYFTHASLAPPSTFPKRQLANRQPWEIGPGLGKRTAKAWLLGQASRQAIR